MARHVAVEALVRSEHAQQVRGDLVRRGAPLPLPEQGVEVVGATQMRNSLVILLTMIRLPNLWHYLLCSCSIEFGASRRQNRLPAGASNLWLLARKDGALQAAIPTQELPTLP